MSLEIVDAAIVSRKWLEDLIEPPALDTRRSYMKIMKTMRSTQWRRGIGGVQPIEVSTRGSFGSGGFAVMERSSRDWLGRSRLRHWALELERFLVGKVHLRTSEVRNPLEDHLRDGLVRITRNIEQGECLGRAMHGGDAHGSVPRRVVEQARRCAEHLNRRAEALMGRSSVAQAGLRLGTTGGHDVSGGRMEGRDQRTSGLQYDSTPRCSGTGAARESVKTEGNENKVLGYGCVSPPFGGTQQRRIDERAVRIDGFAQSADEVEPPAAVSQPEGKLYAQQDRLYLQGDGVHVFIDAGLVRIERTLEVLSGEGEDTGDSQDFLGLVPGLSRADERQERDLLAVDSCNLLAAPAVSHALRPIAGQREMRWKTVEWGPGEDRLPPENTACILMHRIQEGEQGKGNGPKLSDEMSWGVDKTRRLRAGVSREAVPYWQLVGISFSLPPPLGDTANECRVRSHALRMFHNVRSILEEQTLSRFREVRSSVADVATNPLTESFRRRGGGTKIFMYGTWNGFNVIYPGPATGRRCGISPTPSVAQNTESRFGYSV
ncbi:hypothetical protein FB451DRAFT_1172600 [Mycena latifolia]|nr:hypothetical protein FB451DRAFT_1172600 [Mycena latifolia]